MPDPKWQDLACREFLLLKLEAIPTMCKDNKR